MFRNIFYSTQSPAARPAFKDPGGKITLAIFRCRKITIAAVNGHAAGLGITALQLPCDFRFVWAGAKLALPFVRRGITPEGTHHTTVSLIHTFYIYIYIGCTTRRNLDFSPPAPPRLFALGRAAAHGRHAFAGLAAPAGTILRDVPEPRGRVPGRARVCARARGEHVADERRVDQGAAVAWRGQYRRTARPRFARII
jgi:enoyl-CoA hydratase/carnithine racemase